MLPTHFLDIDGNLSDHKEGEMFGLFKNSDNAFVTVCFICDFIGITCSLLLYLRRPLQVVRSCSKSFEHVQILMSFHEFYWVVRICSTT